MKVLVVGGGPAGLSFAALLAQSSPSHDVTVLERNRVGEAPGWGVTIRTHALSFLGIDKRLTAQILEGRAFWYRGELAVDLPYPPTVGLATVSRAALLEALVGCCRDAGAHLRFESDGARWGDSELADYDLVVAADGAHSALRQRHADAFRPTIVPGKNRYSWLATERSFDKLSILMEDGDVPLLAWGYRYTDRLSTFIVESTEKTLEASGLARLPASDACKAIAKVFERALGGAAVLCGGAVRWHAFPEIACERLRHRNIALIGDAAHTTHFSQGFGTMFAFDDALALFEAVATASSVEQALDQYEAIQKPKIASLQQTAASSMRWAEAAVEAAEGRDEAKARALIAARWPNNEVPPAPMASYNT